jgi:hypothetical protein
MTFIISIIEQMPVDCWQVRGEIANYEFFFVEWDHQSHVIPELLRYALMDLNMQNVSMLPHYYMRSVEPKIERRDVSWENEICTNYTIDLTPILYVRLPNVKAFRWRANDMKVRDAL